MDPWTRWPTPTSESAGADDGDDEEEEDEDGVMTGFAAPSKKTLRDTTGSCAAMNLAQQMQSTAARDEGWQLHFQLVDNGSRRLPATGQPM